MPPPWPTMRIPDERQHLTQAAAPSVRKATARAVEVPRQAETNAATTVAISAEARRLSASAPTVDHAKVTRLREAMATSTYVVQPSRIAQAMMGAVPA
jgi:flagellar biosynthesis anti-sigma factor FlgM